MTFLDARVPYSAPNSSNDETTQRAASRSDELNGGAGADALDAPAADMTYPPQIVTTASLVVQANGAFANGTFEQAVRAPAITGTRYPNWRFARGAAAARPADPKYRLPIKIISAAALSSFRNRKRDLRSDAAALVASLPVEPLVCGIEHIPTSRPFVILPNHYERPSGAWVGWGAIIVSNAIARSSPGSLPIRWVMTSTWQDCYIGPKRVDPKYLHWVLRRLSGLYGIILMPADDIDAFGRGAALRNVFRALTDPVGQVVAFHPEAGGFETMIRPPKGIGRVLSTIDRQGIQMIPTGVYEAEGRFHVSFGPAMPAGSLQHLADADAAEEVMLRIARLVPEQTRGVFAGKVAAEMPTSNVQ